MSLSGRIVSSDYSVDLIQHTVLVVTVASNGDDLSAYLCALLGDVVLADVLSHDNGGQGSGNGELLKEHCDWFLRIIEWSCVGCVTELVVVELLFVVMIPEAVDEAGLYTPSSS